jgi:membrane protease YdiL (CAAX protease family)
MKIQALVRGHPLITYFVCVFLLSWGGLFVLLGPATALGGWSQSVGFGFVTILLGTLLGPAVSGFGLTALLTGRPGLRELRTRLFRWRVGARWYALAVLAAPVSAAAALLALSLVTPEHLPGVFAGEWIVIVAGAYAASAVIALLEEIGWTGFAIPRLRERYGTVATGLLLGVLWGLWHGPLFWSAARAAGQTQWPLVLVVMLFSFLPPFRVLMVWAYDRTGSVLIAVLMHTSLSATTIACQLLGRGIPTVPFDLAFAAFFWAAVAVGAAGLRARGPHAAVQAAVVKTGRDLGPPAPRPGQRLQTR